MSRVLLGSITSYYAWRGALPYLNFDGVDDYATIPFRPTGDFDITFQYTPRAVATGAFQGVFDQMNSTSTTGFAVRLHNSVNRFEFWTTDGSVSDRIFGNADIVANTTYTIRISVVGLVKRMWVNGVMFTSTPTAIVRNTSSDAILGKSFAVSYSNGYFGAINITSNGYSYIQQGDQNGNSILPSTPAGQNGTISGAGWKYVGINGHYETVALLNSYISSTTLTEPLEVMLIDPLDTSTVPTSKDGFPITIFNGTNYRNYDFSFSTRW